MDNSLKNRFTFVAHAYYQQAGEQPESFDVQWSKDLASNETPFRRNTFKVTNEWMLLNLAWLQTSKLRMLCLVNEEGKFFNTIPTAEELAESNAKVVELSTDKSHVSTWLVRPGESMHGCPNTVEGIWVRCLSGEAKISIYVVPE